ncbi:tyrosinase family protein [Caulobacter sp.]|uniref:tyrosinase family protein n=1 Tax=Caulobacter sp. TaxID=78 RepID=UPI003BB1C691
MLDRRTMLGAGLAAAGISTGLGADQALAQSVRTRISWPAFVNTPSYGKFVAAVKKMRDNKNPSDPNSWVYWANIHRSYCPHGIPYFLTWHRGYIFRFEQQIRAISGDPGFNLPYWDYYANANLPREFTTPGDAGNPLWTRRTNTNVSAALGFGFTQPQYVNFPRNWPSAMEPQIESLPHNQVHNIIGGVMPTMLSPEDPIFWVHHANIDRLWCAWISAGGGRTMPATSDPYWSGGFNYGPTTQGVPKVQTRDTSTFGYVYDNQRLPRPPALRTPARPMLRAVPMNAEKAIDGVISLGDSQGALTLDDRSFSVSVPLGPQGRLKAGALAEAAPRAPAPTELNVVLDEVALTEIGKDGGYFYKVYVNLPTTGGAPEERHLIGTVGAFEIAGALHHPEGGEQHADHAEGGKAKLVLPATDVLRGLSPGQLSQLVVSFVRVDGANAPKGPAITIGDFSVQATSPTR